MIYPILQQAIPHERRIEINEKILFDIDTGKGLIENETIYNCYTGLGGLHNLKQKDFPNYNEFAKAKKAVELGQFFTPHDICKQMVDLASPLPEDMILDMCCGMGNFFNHVPNLFNAFGFDIDHNAVKVAKHLYPDANIEVMDLKRYNPEQRFDIVIGNPPFNLDFIGIQSQYYYCRKAYDILNPSGLLLLIVPCSFLQSDFWNKKEVTTMNRNFSFLGQAKLSPKAFAPLGVKHFQTKIVAFLRQSSNIEMQPYSAETFISLDEIKAKISQARGIRQEQKLNLHRETNELLLSEQQEFDYKLNKYMYELKAHKHLQKHYPKAIALVTKYRNQKPPKDCTEAEMKDWEKRKLTPKKVLGILKKYIKHQGIDPSRKLVLSRTQNKEVALIRTKYDFKLKAYAPRLLDNVEVKSVKIYDLVVNGSGLPQPKKMTVKLRSQYQQAEKEIAKLRRNYLKETVPYEEMKRDPVLEKKISKLRFINPRNKNVIRFNKLQRQDMGLLFQKRYPLLNWQQGSGKTGVAYHFAKHLMEQGKVKGTIVLAPAIAIHMTWEPFMIANNEPYVILDDIAGFKNVPKGVFLLVSNSMLDKLEKHLKRLMKMWSQKACLLFDESDEITNPNAARTKLTLSCFRRLRYAMEATGTTTRNYIGELYPQLELLYNNSMFMICNCRQRYSQNKEGEIVGYTNEYYGKPFPPRYGATIFKSCFSPAKATVFGIEKHNQDIYNQEHLTGIIGRTILTRKFKEFAGDKFSVDTHCVKPSAGEIKVQDTVLHDFHRICDLYFEKLKDSRKQAALKISRQIKLLIRSCSVPHKFPDYFGDEYPEKAKYIAEMIFTIPDKVAVGCISHEAMKMYSEYLADVFPGRQIFRINGQVPFDKRQKILDQFEATDNGILVCTQQSLKSSVNIPSCNNVIIEALQWNIPRMEQFYFRFIRLDCQEHTNVHYVTYSDSIEQNIMALVLTKERINEFIKTGEIMEESDILDEFGISAEEIETLLQRNYDDQGKAFFTWGSQKVA